MARKCCVKNCDCDGHEARFKGLPLHKFPKDAALRSRWLANGSFEANFKPTPGQFVCHRHFKRADYETIKGQKYVLRKGSVPTIFSDYDNHPGTSAIGRFNGRRFARSARYFVIPQVPRAVGRNWCE